MFKRQYRFPAQSKLKHPNSYVSEFFILKYAKNDYSFSRFGFIVSKKIDKRAVKRNQIKRRIRAYLEGIKPQIISGYDMLFILRKNTTKKTNKEVIEEVQESLVKNKLTKEYENTHN